MSKLLFQCANEELGVALVPVIEGWDECYLELKKVPDLEKRKQLFTQVKIREFDNWQIKILYDAIFFDDLPREQFLNILETLNTSLTLPRKKRLVLTSFDKDKSLMKVHMFSLQYVVNHYNSSYSGEFLTVGYTSKANYGPDIFYKKRYYWGLDTLTQRWSLFKTDSWEIFARGVEDINNLSEYVEEAEQLLIKEQEVWEGVYLENEETAWKDAKEKALKNGHKEPENLPKRFNLVDPSGVWI